MTANNFFHSPACVEADIARLRKLRSEIDRAIVACYGWADLDLRHSSHVNERGHVRYTISPDARREILRHLLTLNLKVVAREAEQGDQC